MVGMSNPLATGAPQIVEPLVAPAGLNLLSDSNAGSCCGGSCALPTD
jgi:hypothetical protein